MPTQSVDRKGLLISVTQAPCEATRARKRVYWTKSLPSLSMALVDISGDRKRTSVQGERKTHPNNVLARPYCIYLRPGVEFNHSL